MWNYNKEDLVAEVKVGGGFLDKSGCYDMTIDAIEDKETKNGAKQLFIKFQEKNSGAKVNIFFVYTKTTGEYIDFKVRQLNQLCGLLKITPDKIATAVGKEIGVFLKAKGTDASGKFINWEVEGFYDVKTKGSVKELVEKSGVGDVYGKFEEKYAKDEPVKTSYGNSGSNATTKTQVEDEESDFPFN